MRPVTPPVTRRRTRLLRRSFAGDTIAIALALGAANYFLFRGDPCWLNSNPTPLLLLPILIGGRYGSFAGLLTGLLTTGAVFGVMHLLGTRPAALLETNTLALAAFPITGLLCGEIHSFFKANAIALSERCDQLEVQHGRASANLELYADSNIALQKRLAVHGVRFTSLDSELRRLLAPSDNDLYSESLALLNRVTDISEAAIYSLDGRELKREALLGNGDELPDTLRSDKVEIIDQALAEKQMVTCRELWGNTPQLFSRHLAAIPWLDPHGEVGAVLLIRRLPFHCVTWQNFAQIETICAWISQYAQLKIDAASPAGEDAYERTVALCIDTHQKHALPSAGVHFVAADDQRITQKKLQDALTPHLRATDVTTRLVGDRPNLAVLLPMEGRREAERLVAQINASLEVPLHTKLTQTKGLDSTERFMRRLRNGS